MRLAVLARLRVRLQRNRGAGRGGAASLLSRGEAREQAEQRQARRRLLARRTGALIATISVAVVLAVGVFPTRTWLDQRRSSAEASERLTVLRDQNAALSERIDGLQTDGEIERLAREQYNLVKPGEEAYAVLPPPLPPLDLPPIFPFGEILPAETGADAASGTAGAPGASPSTTTPPPPIAPTSG